MDVAEVADAVKVVVSFVDQTTGQPTTIDVTYDQYIPIILVLKQYGRQGSSRVFHLMLLGGTVALHVRHTNMAVSTMPAKLMRNERIRVADILNHIQRAIQKHFKNNEEAVIAATYVGLVRDACTRSEAALFASAMLGRTITSEAWRKRVDRWAQDKSRNLPPVGLSSGRPRTKEIT